MTTTVLYHDDADGFGSAFACYHAGGLEDATYIPVNYGQHVPEIPAGTKELYIVDFSYPRDVCDMLAEQYELTVIDHHKTAKDALEGASYAIFDMSKSGCALVWEHFTTDALPAILRYVQDRDLWLFKLKRSKEVNAYIATLPFDFETWRGFDLGVAINAGVAILAFQQQQIDNAMKRVFLTAISGYIVPLCNATDNISDLGNAMCAAYPNHPFSVSYCDRSDGSRTFSLRSIGEFDVSAVAKLHDGGGHRNAAGFVVTLPAPLVRV